MSHTNGYTNGYTNVDTNGDTNGNTNGNTNGDTPTDTDGDTDGDTDEDTFERTPSFQEEPDITEDMAISFEKLSENELCWEALHILAKKAASKIVISHLIVWIRARRMFMESRDLTRDEPKPQEELHQPELAIVWCFDQVEEERKSRGGQEEPKERTWKRGYGLLENYLTEHRREVDHMFRGLLDNDLDDESEEVSERYLNWEEEVDILTDFVERNGKELCT